MKKTITLYDGARRIHLFKVGSAELDIPDPADGIKVLGRGEYLVLPSTIADTKSRYRFVAARGPGEIWLAAAPKWLSPASPPSGVQPTPARAMQIRRILIVDIIVDDDRREVDEDDIAAKKKSFESIGMMTPITVRQEDDGPHLTAGQQRYETAKALGWETIDAAFFEGDKIDAKIWQDRENLDHLNYTALQRFEATARIMRLEAERISRQKVGKSRGRPESAGKKVARSLRFAGKTEAARTKTGERADKVDRLPEEVKEKVKAQGLDNKATALVEIAKEKSPEAQLEKIDEIVKRKAKAQAVKRNRVKKSKAEAPEEKAPPQTHPDDVAAPEVQRLKAELAAQGEQLQRAEEALRQARLGAARAARDAATAPATVPAQVGDDDLEIPAYLDRRPLTAEQEESLSALMAAWANDHKLKALFAVACAIVRERFIAWMRTVDHARDSSVGTKP
jgi:ParB-like chromosome segregation protein Spo0J